MKRPLRVGIVGCGGIARAHVAAYRADGAASIVGVYDSHAPAATALAAETNAAVAQSVRALVSDFALDAVSVCSPPGTHLANCQPFVEAGIAVLCEKPLEADLQRARDLAALVRRHDALFMPAFCHRFHPAIVALKALIDAGALGDLLFFRNIFGAYVALAGNHRADPALSGGGVLIDNGCHAIDLFRHLVGEPSRVQALAANVLQPLTVEDFGLIQLSTGSGAHGQIASGYSLRTCPNTIDLFGSAGSATVNYFDPAQPELLLRREGAAPEAIDCNGQPDRFSAEVAHFLNCVRDGVRPSVSVEDGLCANQVIAAVYASIKSGRNEDVDYA